MTSQEAASSPQDCASRIAERPGDGISLLKSEPLIFFGCQTGKILLFISPSAGAEQRWEAAARTSLQEGVELMLSEGKRRGPSSPASSQRARTQTCARRYAFPIFSSTAYHVIVETYAGERADMCSGPGVRREAEGYTVRCR